MADTCQINSMKVFCKAWVLDLNDDRKSRKIHCADVYYYGVSNDLAQKELSYLQLEIANPVAPPPLCSIGDVVLGWDVVDH